MAFLRRTRFLLALSLVLVAPLFARASQPLPVGPGLDVTTLFRPEGPWAIHVLTADLSNQYLGLGTLLGGGTGLGRCGVSTMLRNCPSQDRRPIAGINGDFFAQTGRNYVTIPLGFEITDGQLVTLPDTIRSVFYLTKDGQVGIARFRGNAWLVGPGNLLYPISAMNRSPEAAEVALFTPRFGKESRAENVTTQIVLKDLSGPFVPDGEVKATVAGVCTAANVPIPADGAVVAANGVAAFALKALKEGDPVTLRMGIEPKVGDLVQAVGGGPRLVRGGAVSVEARDEGFADTFSTRRHPRSGLGIRGKQVVFVTVDGRQPGYSAGMTLREFAQLFVDLGCSDAMNLDGGGSTTMVIRGRIVNSPSDGSERKVGNGIALYSLAPPPPPPGAPPRPAVRVVLDPDEASVLSGEKLALRAEGLDEYCEPTPVNANSVRWQVSAALGSVDLNGVFTAARVTSPAAGLVTAQIGNAVASTVVSVVPGPAKLVLMPQQVTLPLGGKQQFMVRAYDEDNRLLQVPPSRFAWLVEPSTATIDGRGLLRVPKAEGQYKVTVSVAGASTRSDVLVGAITEIADDFEKAETPRFTSTPAGVPGSAAVVADPLNAANHCVKLSYDFSNAKETRTASAVLNVSLPEARSISLRVLGDGQGAWLRARVRDAAGTIFPITLADKIDWSGQWKRVSGWLPEEAVMPAMLESIYVTEFHTDRQPVGAIYLDDVGVSSLSKQEAKTVQSSSTGKE